MDEGSVAMHKRRQSVSERKSAQSWRRGGSTAAQSVLGSRDAYLTLAAINRHPSPTPGICQHDPQSMCWRSPSVYSDYDLLGEDSWWTRIRGRRTLFPLRQILTATQFSGNPIPLPSRDLDTSGLVPIIMVSTSLPSPEVDNEFVGTGHHNDACSQHTRCHGFRNASRYMTLCRVRRHSLGGIYIRVATGIMVC